MMGDWRGKYVLLVLLVLVDTIINISSAKSMQKVCGKNLDFFALFALQKHKKGRAVKTIVLRAAIVN